MRNCPEDTVVCAYCGISGHRRRDCVVYMELELGESLVLDTPQQRDARKKDYNRPQAEAETDRHIDGEKLKEGPTEHRAVLIGASLIKHIDLGTDAQVIAKPGATAANVDQVLSMALEMVDPKNIEQVVMHLGTNDALQNKDDSDTVKLNMAECIGKVGKTFPDAILAISSIPPRKGKSQNVTRYNDQVSSVNTYLKKVADRSENLVYLDNTHVFMNGTNVNRRHYSDSDSSGVHLSRDGQLALTDAFLEYLSQAKTYENNIDNRKRVRSEGSNIPNSAEKLPKQPWGGTPSGSTP